MKVSLKWLKEYVDITLPVAEVAQRLTMAGIEVKGIEATGGDWEHIVIGQITAINPHPNADRLTLPTINLGTEQVSVVCGAPNLRMGDKVAFAHVGARIIDPHTGQVTTLKPARIRGIASRGMVCSEKELGISDSHKGVLVLPEDAPLGIPLADYLGDVILDLEVTPNRPDCLSVIGIAREIAALTGQAPHIADASYAEIGAPVGQQVAVEIIAPDLCPRYCASLITGVAVAESPDWMQHRLLACGMRPINNIVDITNYVMLEYGQPLHAFDYQRIRDKKIIVRRADDSEKFETLDGLERTLSRDMLVIADGERTVAIAGVMGGANSEVVEETTSILLEAASFFPASIHHTGRTLGLPSEACMRFERGISPGLTLRALRRATQLLVELCGGQAARGVVDAYPGKQTRLPVRLSGDEVNRLLGADFSLEQIISVLTSLGFECQRADSAVLVTAPYWRSDIRLTVDLIEEVARIAGYDRIPMTMLSQPIPRHDPEPIIGLKHSVRHLLTGYGFQEIISYSLTSLEMLNNLLSTQPVAPFPLRVDNPMTAEQEYLRPDLRAGLMSCLSANRRYEEGGVRLFELGRVYLPKPGDLPDEREVLCGVLSGTLLGRWWQGEDQPPDFFEAKGIVASLLSQLGLEAGFGACSDQGLHSTKRAAIIVDGNEVGVVGELHPQVLERLEITESVYLFEIDLVTLLPFTAVARVFQPLPRFPAVVRDMALVVGAGVSHQEVSEIIRGFDLVVRVAIFDVYTGGQVPAGKKSLAYRLTFQSPDRTLTDEEVNAVQQQILERLAKELGASLRA